jgi:pimeloyl-ACP methyl ester carboxylesterase
MADQLHASFVMVEGAGHYPHAELPETVAPAIVRFLSETASAHAA